MSLLGLGLRIKIIDGRPVIRGFNPEYYINNKIDPNSEISENSCLAIANDVIIAVNNLDAKSVSLEVFTILVIMIINFIIIISDF